MLDLQLGAAPGPAAGGFVKDTDETRFEHDVIVASMKQPVIAFFWAGQSVLCKQMMPLLEKIVNATGGAVHMMRVDIDRNRGIAQALRIQTVPTVYAFFQGKPVEGFSGSKPEADLKTIVARLAKMATGGPTVQDEQIKKLMDEGNKFFQQSNIEEALGCYSAALEMDPENMDALGGIGWCLLTLGDVASVRDMLTQVSPEQQASPRLKGLQFILSLSEKADGLEDMAGLEKKAAAKDLQAQYDLSVRLLGAGQMEKGIDTLIALIRVNREWQEQKARKFLLDLFGALGNAHPLTMSGRRKLSSVLFS